MEPFKRGFDIIWFGTAGDPTQHITEPARWGMQSWTGDAYATSLCGFYLKRQDHSNLSGTAGFWAGFKMNQSFEFMPEIIKDLEDNTCPSCIFVLGQLLRGES